MSIDVWEPVGQVGVDSGVLWLGDPCYVMPDDAEDNPGADWVEFARQLEVDQPRVWQNRNGATIGITVPTGDGGFPVSVRRNEAGGVVEIRVELA